MSPVSAKEENAHSNNRPNKRSNIDPKAQPKVNPQTTVKPQPTVPQPTMKPNVQPTRSNAAKSNTHPVKTVSNVAKASHTQDPPQIPIHFNINTKLVPTKKRIKYSQHLY